MERDGTPSAAVPQPLFIDYIDFPVSDLWRDHYASQSLTYPSGRYDSKRTYASQGVDPTKDLSEETSLARAIRLLTEELRQLRTPEKRLVKAREQARVDTVTPRIPILCRVEE